MRERHQYTLVYDGNCNVCTRMVEQLRSWDRAGAIELLPSQDPSVAERFPRIPPAAYDEAMQLIDRGGRSWAGAAAIERLLEVLPRSGFFRAAFRIPGMRRVADRAYRWFARNRHRLGCGRHCGVP